MGTRFPAVAACAAVLVGAGVAAPAIAQTPSFTLLGVPGGGYGNAISDDGNTAVGSSSEFPQPSFMWTRSGGRVDFDPPGDAYGVSGDGVYAVGGGGRAFRWSQAHGLEDISSGLTISTAFDANRDGSVIVGSTRAAISAPDRPFRWTQTGGMQLLSTTVDAVALGVSADGNTVIGSADFPSRGFIWTPGTGMQFLPSVTGEGTAVASGISSDGTIIVGYSGPSLSIPTMWINAVPHALAISHPNWGFLPADVSDDGRIVSGNMMEGGTGRLFPGVWTLETGAIALTDYLAMNGVVVPSEPRLANCKGMSANGLSFVGDARYPGGSPDAYVATIPAPGAVLWVLAGFAFARRNRDHNAGGVALVPLRRVGVAFVRL